MKTQGAFHQAHPPPPLYHRGGVTLLVRSRVNILKLLMNVTSYLTIIFAEKINGKKKEKSISALA